MQQAHDFLHVPIVPDMNAAGTCWTRTLRETSSSRLCSPLSQSCRAISGKSSFANTFKNWISYICRNNIKHQERVLLRVHWEGQGANKAGEGNGDGWYNPENLPSKMTSNLSNKFAGGRWVLWGICGRHTSVWRKNQRCLINQNIAYAC